MAGAKGRGFSTLETVVALSTFLLVAVSLATASLSISSALTRAEARVNLVRLVDSRLAQVAALPFATLVDGTWTAPDACPAPAGPSGKVQRSCVRLGATEAEIGYTVTAGTEEATATGVGPSYLDVTATSVLAGRPPTTVTRARRVALPVTGYRSDRAVVRIRLAGGAGRFDLPVVIVDRNGKAVTDSLRFDGTLAVARVDPASCSGAAAPCRVGLAAGTTWYSAGGWVLSPSDIVAPGSALTLAPGQIAEVSVSPALAARAVVRVLAQGVDGAPAATGAPPGSVCLWATFDDVLGRRSLPFCNGGDGSTITVDRFAGPGGDGSSIAVYPIADGTRFTLSTDSPDGTCPARGSWRAQGTYRGLDDLTGAGANGTWVAADVCTGWTWGAPSLLAAGGNAPAPVTATPELAVTAAGSTYDLIWTATDASGAAVGRPAAGSAAVGVWSKPRRADRAGPQAGCATDGNAATVCRSPLVPAVTVPEAAPGAPPACTSDAFCLSGAPVPPAFVAPKANTAVRVSAVAGATSYFSLDARDADGDAVTLTLDTLPAGGTLRAVTGPGTSVPLAPGSRLGPQGAESSFALAFVPTVTLTGLAPFDATLTDSTGRSTRRTFFLYATAQPFTATLGALTLAQGQGSTGSTPAATGTVTVTDTAGAAAAAGTRVTLTTTAPGVTLVAAGATGPAVTATTDALGKISFSATAAPGAPAGVTRGGLVARLDNGRAASADVTVTPTLAVLGTTTVGSLTVTGPATLAQGAKLDNAVTVTARDGAGALLDGVVVAVEAGPGATQAAAVRVGGPCVTGSSAPGACTLGVTVDPDAPSTPAGATGDYALTARGRSGPLSTAAAAAPVTARSGALSVTASLARLALGAGATCAATTDTTDTGAAPLIVAQSGTVTVAVTACDGAGRPLAGVALRAANVSTALTLAEAGGGTATTDSSGRATFTLSTAANAPAGPATVVPSVTGPAGTPAVPVSPVTVTPTASSITGPGVAVTVRAGGSARVTVTVRDGAGARLAGAKVRATSDSAALEVAKGATTDATGVATLVVRAKAGAAGPARLTLSTGTSAVAARVDVTVSTSAYTVVPRTSRTTFAQGTSATWSLEVRAGAGAPAPGVVVAPSCPAGTTPSCTGLAFAPASATSDADGRVAFTVTVGRTAPLGEVPVTVTVAGAALPVPLVVAPSPASVVITTDAGPAVGPVTVPLAAGKVTVVPVRVTDAAGAPAAGVAVWASAPGSALRIRGGRTDAAGTAYLVVSVPATASGTVSLIVRAGSVTTSATGAIT